MTCYHPLKGYRSAQLNASGKRPIVFSPKDGFMDMPVELACGQCIGCRLERSRQWAVRCSHEASLFRRNCFLTLTFDDSHLPSDRSLDVDIYQRFMKRFRKSFSGHESVTDSDGKSSFPIRFFHCGEYGSKFGRPHYHACIFNFDFDDKRLFKVVNKQNLYTSENLQELWPYGFSTVGTLTFESAAYVARYITKKVNGEASDDHYRRVDLSTGEVFDLKPEYTTMSRRPGIGSRWLEKFHTDVYPSDQLVVRGKITRPPRFYDAYYEHHYPADYLTLKHKRKLEALKHADNQTYDRLAVRKTVLLSKISTLKRTLEDES